MIQLGVGFSLSNAPITELSELRKEGRSFLHWEKAAAGNRFPISVADFGSKPVLLRYIFKKIKIRAFWYIIVKLGLEIDCAQNDIYYYLPL